MNAVEEGSILKYTATGDELPHTSRIKPSEFGTDRENRLRFRSEIKCLFPFVIVNSVHPITIVEKHRPSPTTVGEQTVEPAVQASGKCRILLV